MYIEVKNAVKKYGDGDAAVYALNGASLSVSKGEVCVILGPSGSGKSTLMNMLGGIDNLDSGEILFDGYDISGLSSHQLTQFRRERVGFVFQFYNLIPSLTVRENIETTKDISVHPSLDIETLMTEMGISDLADRFPNEISGGQQQRVAIARAAVKNPDLMLCDELTGALDSKSAKDVLSFIEKINETYGTTIFIVTHNEAIKDMADRIIFVRDGKIVSQEENMSKKAVSDITL